MRLTLQIYEQSWESYLAEMERKRAENRVGFDPDPSFDDRPGHCWRCSHRTQNEDRTCDFCLLEIIADG